jgi:membrane protease YdiL (CAAX protease family)
VIATLRRDSAAVAAAGVAAAGCALLVVRPLLLRVTSDPTSLLVLLFVVLLAAGVGWPMAAPAEESMTNTAGPMVAAAVLVAGVAAFAAGRLVGWPGIAAVSGRFVVLNGLAAVAEEAFFRRFVFGVLQRHGVALSIAGSSLLFAIVHVTVYGMWALPIDLAAGLLLGWQRWATGSWRVPAVTHVVANVLMVVR